MRSSQRVNQAVAPWMFEPPKRGWLVAHLYGRLWLVRSALTNFWASKNHDFFSRFDCHFYDNHTFEFC
jgi:hypothetical protein